MQAAASVNHFCHCLSDVIKADITEINIQPFKLSESVIAICAAIKNRR